MIDLSRPLAFLRFGGNRKAPDHRADAGQQLSRLERFGEIIIRSELQSDDPVDRLVDGRHHDDRNLRLDPDIAAKLKAVPARKHHIENHQIKTLTLQLRLHLKLIMRQRHAIAMALEEVANEIASVAVVIHDKKMGDFL